MRFELIRSGRYNVQDSIMHSEESVDEDIQTWCKNYKKYRNITSAAAVLLMLYVIVLVISINIYTNFEVTCQHIDCTTKLVVSTTKYNRTECLQFEQFPLTEEMYAVTCREGDNEKLEINRFMKGERGLQYIRLNKTQWMYLKKSVRHIDKSFFEMQEIS